MHPVLKLFKGRFVELDPLIEHAVLKGEAETGSVLLEVSVEALV